MFDPLLDKMQTAITDKTHPRHTEVVDFVSHHIVISHSNHNAKAVEDACSLLLAQEQHCATEPKSKRLSGNQIPPNPIDTRPLPINALSFVMASPDSILKSPSHHRERLTVILVKIAIPNGLGKFAHKLAIRLAPDILLQLCHEQHLSR